jgi:cob(I)alamin adenosyltransferase
MSSDQEKQAWKIYTRKGDTGETSLIGGKRVPKNDIRVEAYGTVDELNSFTGLIRDNLPPGPELDAIIKIQEDLFVTESHLAAESNEVSAMLPPLTQADITFLENEIDRMNQGLPELKNFILPGGHTLVSYCHIARTVCRRAERIVLSLNEVTPAPPMAIIYLNRLSDYFFVLARRLAFDKGIDEIIWKTK